LPNATLSFTCAVIQAKVRPPRQSEKQQSEPIRRASVQDAAQGGAVDGFAALVEGNDGRFVGISAEIAAAYPPRPAASRARLSGIS
jgi:hypothetical protein